MTKQVRHIRKSKKGKVYKAGRRKMCPLCNMIGRRGTLTKRDKYTYKCNRCGQYFTAEGIETGALYR